MHLVLAQPGVDAAQKFAGEFGVVALIAVFALIAMGVFLWVYVTKIVPKQFDDLRADHKEQVTKLMDVQKTEAERTAATARDHIKRLMEFIEVQRNEFTGAIKIVTEAHSHSSARMEAAVVRIEAHNQRVTDEIVRRLDALTNRVEESIRTNGNTE